ncbi:hypothetical protein GCM10011577_19210 [Pseudarthrobacter polychromogenes]|uniref:CBU-0592-like domain-containing protein n=1 Tax=Pseudarthrobacter polychromogenes TaxID=1676 RepID=A0ABQ1XKI5_9MICC|nr:hypothetical protein GCM10011577_19210 [Pseudarthrobacter polychromogenes]
MELLWETAGWAGAAAILSAYLAVSMGWLKAGKGFQTANLVGAVAFTEGLRRSSARWLALRVPGCGAPVNAQAVTVEEQCAAFSLVLLKPEEAAVEGEHVDAS